MPKAKPAATHRALARPGDPFVTGDGRVIPPAKDVKPRDRERERARYTQPHEFRPVKRINVKELPAPAKIMNGVGVIFMYTMLGLSDREIVDLLKLTQNQVEEIRQHTAYSQLFNSVLHEFVNAESELIESRIAAYSHNALTRISELSENAEEEGISLRASQDLMDRAGHGPKSKDNKTGLSVNDLRIVVVNGNAQVDVSIDTPQ